MASLTKTLDGRDPISSDINNEDDDGQSMSTPQYSIMEVTAIYFEKLEDYFAEELAEMVRTSTHPNQQRLTTWCYSHLTILLVQSGREIRRRARVQRGKQRRRRRRRRRRSRRRRRRRGPAVQTKVNLQMSCTWNWVARPCLHRLRALHNLWLCTQLPALSCRKSAAVLTRPHGQSLVRQNI